MNRFRLSRILHPRNLSVALFYILVMVASYYIGYELRFDFSVPENHAADRVSTIWWVIVMKLMLLISFGQVHCVLSYFRLPDALRLFFSLFLGCIVLLSMWYVYEGDQVPPRAVILSDFLLSFLAIAGFRAAFRVKASRKLSDWFGDHPLKNVIIVGAGEVGATICSELMEKPRLGMRPIAFLDDKSPNKSTSITKAFRAGEAFIGTANTWHYSQNLGSEDLIFTTSWLAEKDAPITVLADKE